MRRRLYYALLAAQWLVLIGAGVLVSFAHATRSRTLLTAAIAYLLGGYLITLLIPIVKPKPLTLDEQIEREVAMSRHPAGSKRTSS